MWVLSMRRIQTRRPVISVLGILFLYYFLEYCLLCVLSIFFFSLLGTPTIWILTILDGSCNFLLFPIFSLFILLLYFITVNLMLKILCI